MKRNAIVRIVIFSITIAVLLGILVTGIAYVRYSGYSYSGSRDIVLGPIATGENSDGEKVNMGAVSAETITEIEIEWAAGKILIQPDETVNTIRFSEDAVSDEKYQMVYKTSGNKLTIQFCKDSLWDSSFGITINSTIDKDLTVLVPINWVCDSLEIEAASATVEIHDLTIREVEFDGASGTCGFENCNVDTLDIDTASGDVIFTGTLKVLDCDGASASITAILNNIPSRLDVDTMSGDLDITLPENAGFTVSLDTMSSDFSSDFETTSKNGNHIHGDGSCRIDVSAMNGDVTIRKNPNLTSVDLTLPDETQP